MAAKSAGARVGMSSVPPSCVGSGKEYRGFGVWCFGGAGRKSFMACRPRTSPWSSAGMLGATVIAK